MSTSSGKIPIRAKTIRKFVKLVYANYDELIALKNAIMNHSEV